VKLALAFLLLSFFRPAAKPAKTPPPAELFESKGATFRALSDQMGDEAPTWAEGGRSIVFRATRGSWLGKKYKAPQNDQQIWLVRLDSGEQVNLAEGVVGWKSVPSWNQALERVLVYADLKKGGPAIYSVNPGSPGTFHRIADPPIPAAKGRSVSALSSSKDGRVIAAVATDESATSSVWVRRIGDPNDTAWKRLDIGGATNVQRPVFAPDDKTIFLTSIEDVLNQRGPIWRSTIDGKPERTKETGCCVNVAPTGEDLLYVKNRAVQMAQLPSMTWKGTLIKPKHGIISDPKWSPDGKSIVFSWAFGEVGGIYLARFDPKTLETVRVGPNASLRCMAPPPVTKKT
jgi:Tol biopolymer transport system component